MIMPYNLLLASGWTRFVFIQNAIAAVLTVPLLFLLTKEYGPTGAASVWVIINAGFVLISQPLIHRKLLKNELSTWYWNDTLLPMMPSLVTLLAIKFCLQYFAADLQLNFFILCCFCFLGFTISFLFMPGAKVFLIHFIKRIKSHANRSTTFS
jgi:O-antigen/teichoic acid export membrane protein